jgi:hypothetical protein
MATALERQRKPAWPKPAPRPSKSPSWRRGMQARARAAVIGAAGLFVIWQLGLSGGIELARPELRDPTFEIKYRQLAQLIARAPLPTRTVVFLGSSMTGHGAKADIVDKIASDAVGKPVVGYNFGISAAGPFAHLVYIRRLLNRGVRPDVVVLEISPMLFEAPRLETRRFPAYVLEHGDLETVARYAAAPDLCLEWWESHLLPAHGYRRMILSQSARILVPFDDRAELWEDADEHGYRARQPLPPPELQQVLTRVEEGFKRNWTKFKIDPDSLKALKEITELLDRERIACVMVLPPAGPLLRSLYPPEPVAQLLNDFKSLSEQHGFPLVDAAEWCDEDEFTDSHHMNDRGAVKFTNRLISEAIVPTLSGLNPDGR